MKQNHRKYHICVEDDGVIFAIKKIKEDSRFHHGSGLSFHKSGTWGKKILYSTNFKIITYIDEPTTFDGFRTSSESKTQLIKYFKLTREKGTRPKVFLKRIK